MTAFHTIFVSHEDILAGRLTIDIFTGLVGFVLNRLRKVLEDHLHLIQDLIG